jgi:RNA 3'-terminal phosphate cyclase
MINVIVQNLPSKQKMTLDELIDGGLESTAYNAVAETAAEQIRLKLEGRTCPDHPNADQTIIVKALLGKLEFEKTNFCCQKFADGITINYNS